MALIGLSLILASVAWVLVRPPGWLPPWFTQWRGSLLRGVIAAGPEAPLLELEKRVGSEAKTDKDAVPATTVTSSEVLEQNPASAIVNRKTNGTIAMPPPPPPLPTIQPPSIEEPDDSADGQTTPKASATNPPQPIPTFSLEADGDKNPPPPPSTTSSQRSMMPPPSLPTPSNPTLTAPGRMPPPGASPPSRLPMFPAANSAQRARGPLPNRNPLASSSSSGGLAPPPTHTSKPAKPNRKVMLTPGHSPLDWARISGPTADLRGVPSETPYLRVSPSMLKRQTGRKGKDAWMGLNGKVYNISPYADYHPGGVPELLRGAGRDGTKLFGEIHPWVNYETMLSSCLVGLLVEEPEGNQESEMDKMD